MFRPTALTPLPREMNVLKITTLNINGITEYTRAGIFSDFLLRHEIDILSVQEVTSPETLNIRGYVTHSNFGTIMRRTTILARNEILLINIHKLHSGRAIAAEYGGIGS